MELPHVLHDVLEKLEEEQDAGDEPAAGNQGAGGMSGGRSAACSRRQRPHVRPAAARQHARGACRRASPLIPLQRA